MVGKRSINSEAKDVSHGGVYGSENVGMSNRNAGEIPAHRKFKVSWAMIINPGLGDPKARPWRRLYEPILSKLKIVFAKRSLRRSRWIIG